MWVSIGCSPKRDQRNKYSARSIQAEFNLIYVIGFSQKNLTQILKKFLGGFRKFLILLQQNLPAFLLRQVLLLFQLFLLQLWFSFQAFQLLLPLLQKQPDPMEFLFVQRQSSLLRVFLLLQLLPLTALPLPQVRQFPQNSRRQVTHFRQEFLLPR